jgi:prepilin-type N-terminal cleavage/methylation domain-containing protein
MKRRGMNLLETLVAVLISGIVLTVVATLLTTMWR